MFTTTRLISGVNACVQGCLFRVVSADQPNEVNPEIIARAEFSQPLSYHESCSFIHCCLKHVMMELCVGRLRSGGRQSSS